MGTALYLLHAYGELVLSMDPCQFDADGFLVDLSAWSEPLAQQLAELEGIELTDAHWELVFLIRKFYAEFDLSPAMRILSGRGPINLIWQDSQISAKWAFSAKNP